MKETYETKLTKENELKLKIEVLEQQVRDYQCQVESLKEELKELSNRETV